MSEETYNLYIKGKGSEQGKGSNKGNGNGKAKGKGMGDGPEPVWPIEARAKTVVTPLNERIGARVEIGLRALLRSATANSDGEMHMVGAAHGATKQVSKSENAAQTMARATYPP